MRTVRALCSVSAGAVALPLLQACIASDPGGALVVSDGGSVTAPDRATGPAPAPIVETAADAGPRLVTVHGRVVGFLAGAELRDVAVRLVDARGQTSRTTTDAAGRFTVDGIAPPYDLAVCRDGKCASYLAVTREEVRATLENEAVLPQRRAIVRVTVVGPACGTPTCHVQVATASPAAFYGYGSGGASYTTPGAVRMTFEHAWAHVGVTPATTTIAINALVSSDDGTRFFHARGSYEITEGATTQIGLVPREIPVAGAVNVAVDATGLGAGWREPSPSPSARLVLPDRAGAITLGARDGTFALPQLEGARFSASAGTYANVPLVSYRMTTAMTGYLPLASARVTLAVVEPPVWTGPIAGGVLGLTEAFAWSDGPTAARYQMAIDVPDGRRIRVYTTARVVAPARLAALDLDLPPGPGYTVSLSTARPDSSVDALLDPAAVAEDTGARLEDTYEEANFALAP